MASNADYLAFASDTAKAAGELLLEMSESPIAYTKKNRHDIQAEADLASEKLIIDALRNAYPEHVIFAEESGHNAGSSEYRWLVDPLDGTINYEHGIDEYAVSIALEKDGKLLLGVLYQPAHDKLYAAIAGEGAYLNEQKLVINSDRALIDSLVATDNTSKPEFRARNLQMLNHVAQEVRQVRIFGSCSLHLAKVAEGKLDAYIKLNVNYWDIAVGVLLICEAGGVVTDFGGKPIDQDCQDFLAATPSLHPQLIQAISALN